MTSYTCSMCKAVWEILPGTMVKLPYVCPHCGPTDPPVKAPPPQPDHQARTVAALERLVAIGERLLAHFGLSEDDYKARLEDVRSRKPE